MYIRAQFMQKRYVLSNSIFHSRYLFRDDTNIPVHTFFNFYWKLFFLSNVLQNIFNKLQIRQILLALEENSYGIIRYMCVLNCEFDQLCIWLQLCKVTESLFYCKTCCKWKKINKWFILIDERGCKYVEKVSSSYFCFRW